MRKPKIVSSLEKVLDEHKAEEIETIDVRNITPFADYYILATAPNERALESLADYVSDEAAKNGIEGRQPEGNPSSGWIIVDAGEVTVHLFTADKRKEIALSDLVEHAKSKKS